MKYKKAITDFLKSFNKENTLEQTTYQTTSISINMLRQWLNEDRITDPNRMVTNQDIIRWLEIK